MGIPYEGSILLGVYCTKGSNWMHPSLYNTIVLKMSREHFSDHIARLGEIKEKSKKGIFSHSLGQNTVGGIFDRRKVGSFDALI